MWLLTSEAKGEILRARYLDPDKLIRIGLYRWPRSSRWYIQTQDRDGEEEVILDGLADRQTGRRWLQKIMDAMPMRPWLAVDKPNECEYIRLDPESDHHLVVSRVPHSQRWELCTVSPDGCSETLATGLSKEYACALLTQALNAMGVREAVVHTGQECNE